MLLQRTSSGVWEADRLLQEEEEEYLDVRKAIRRAEACHCHALSQMITEPFLLHTAARPLTHSAGYGVFQSEEVTKAAKQGGGHGGRPSYARAHKRRK